MVRECLPKPTGRELYILAGLQPGTQMSASGQRGEGQMMPIREDDYEDGTGEEEEQEESELQGA